MKKHIFCVAYGGGHIRILAPVAQELERRGHRVTILALTTAGAYAAEIGLSVKGYRDYLRLVDRQRVYELGVPLASEMRNPSAQIPFEESVAYLGVNLLEIIDVLGEDAAYEAFGKLGRHAFLPVEFMKKILREERADLMITTNSPKSETAALIAAEACGIPRIRIEDLFIEPNLIEHLKATAGAALYRQTIGRFAIAPSKSCVMCEYSKRLCAERAEPVFGIQIRPEDIVVTGQPIFDEIDSIMATEPRFDLVHDRAGLPTITWAHQNGTPDEESVIVLLSEWFERQGGAFNFVIKIHPNLNPDEVANLKRRFAVKRPGLRIVHKELDANVVLWNSNVILAQSSTMLTQASYMKKPVIVLDPEGVRQYSAHLENGLGLLAKDSVTFDVGIAALIDPNSASSREIQKAIQKMGFKTNGTWNVADVAESLLGAGHDGFPIRNSSESLNQV